MKITFNGREFEVSAEKADEVKALLGIKQKTLAEVAVGDTYFIGDMEFIKFPDLNGGSVAVMKDFAFEARFNDSKDNNFAKSTLFNRLKKEILPKIEALISKENVLEFETDLFTLDGLKIYGTMRSKISLPTFDFYRNNRTIFDKYAVDEYWWLATADGDNTWGVCVSPHGYFSDYYCNICGVRPFCILKSNIFVS